MKPSLFEFTPALWEALRAGDDYVIFCHAHADGDALGSGIALRDFLRAFGKRCEFISPDAPPARYAFLCENADITVFSAARAAALLQGKTVLTVDVASLGMTGDAAPFLSEHGVALSVDHHRVSTPFAQQCFCDAGAAACAEIIADLVLCCGELTAPIARALYTGINTDTGAFRYSNTTARTHFLAGALLSSGIDAAAVNQALYEERPLSQLTAQRVALENLHLFFDHTVGIVTFSEALMAENGLCEEDIDDVVNLIRSIRGIRIAIHLKNRGDTEYKVSMRAKGDANVCDVCKALGGGGHEKAAGCTVFAKSPLLAEQTVLRAVAAQLGKEAPV